MTTPNAYTVGASGGYEHYIATDPDAGKGVGGIAFRTREEAAATLDDGCLPPVWGYGTGVKATVYGLVLHKPFEQQTTRDPVLLTDRYHDWHRPTRFMPKNCPVCSAKKWRLGPDGQLDYDALIEPALLVRLDTDG